MTRNEYRPLEERDAVVEMRVSDLVVEFARLKVEAWTQEPSARRHARLGAVVLELRRRGVLD